jgi:hypothetical protein
MQSKLENNFSRRYNNRIAWGAIIAGTIVSLGYETLLNFLGIGLGLASLNPKNPHVFNLESGATIWLVVSGVVSMGIGGWFVGKFSGISCAFRRGCQGLIAWSLASFLTVMVATAASGAFMGGAVSMNIPNQQEISQSLPNTPNESAANELPLDNMQQDSSNGEIGSYVTNLGKASIALFLAFLMSGIASVAGAVLAGFGENSKEDEESEL